MLWSPSVACPHLVPAVVDVCRFIVFGRDQFVGHLTEGAKAFILGHQGVLKVIVALQECLNVIQCALKSQRRTVPESTVVMQYMWCFLIESYSENKLKQ